MGTSDISSRVTVTTEIWYEGKEKSLKVEFDFAAREGHEIAFTSLVGPTVRKADVEDPQLDPANLVSIGLVNITTETFWWCHPKTFLMQRTRIKYASGWQSLFALLLIPVYGVGLIWLAFLVCQFC